MRGDFGGFLAPTLPIHFRGDRSQETLVADLSHSAFVVLIIDLRSVGHGVALMVTLGFNVGVMALLLRCS